jgi:hypothetical protein
MTMPTLTMQRAHDEVMADEVPTSLSVSMT